MKTLLRFASVMSLLHLFSLTQAQTQQGAFRMGGTGTYTGGKYSSENKFRQFSLQPAVAYFPIANLSVGVTFTTASSYSKSFIGNYNTKNYAVGPELRYYFPFAKWAVFPEVAYVFGKTFSESTNIDFMGDPILYKTELHYSSFRGGVGVTYFINPSVGIEGVVFYQNSQQDVSGPFAGSQGAKSLNFSLGFQVYLNRKD